MKIKCGYWRSRVKEQVEKSGRGLKSQVRLKVVKERLKRFGYGEKEQDTRVPLCEKMIDLRMAYGLWQQNQERERVLWGRSPISNNCFYNHKP